MRRVLWALALALPLLAGAPAQTEYKRRVEAVRRMPGFVALWDFVQRDREQRFIAHQPKGVAHDFHLEAVNYVRDYWNQGRLATYDDLPLLGRGPFGEAVRFRSENEPDFRPCLLVTRDRLHGTGLDVKGPNRSVSMVVWMVRESGNHAIAGIWHEGTDLHSAHGAVQRVERGKRQYALFAGLGAKNGASAVHVSENGAASFGDKYARNLAVTPELIPAVAPGASEEQIDAAWTVVGFSFDNKANTVTAYIDGKATEYWIEEGLEKHPFFQWPYRAWVQAQTRADPGFPKDQLYQPPETRPLSREVLSDAAGERVELQGFPFTRVRVTLKGGKMVKRELVALKVNPFWFGHDLYSPARPEDGGPFTIGRVIHTSRSVGFTGYIGGVAVFGTALSREQMKRLAGVGRTPIALKP